jgi:hypothetical protein
LNPGIYLSAQVLTNDVLALGLALAGVACWERGYHRLGPLALAAAILTKEVHVLEVLALIVASLQARQYRSLLLPLALACLPALAWNLWVWSAIPGGQGENNLGLPGQGLFASVLIWFRLNLAEVVQGLLAALLIPAAGFLALRTRQPFLRWTCVAWSALALVLSTDVWGLPGNALRVLSPLFLFVALAYGDWNARSEKARAAIPQVG